MRKILKLNIFLLVEKIVRFLVDCGPQIRIALFTIMRIPKFRSQPTIAFFASVNHLNGPLRKQNSTSTVFSFANNAVLHSFLSFFLSFSLSLSLSFLFCQKTIRKTNEA